jgi:hypothetical protein
MNKPKTMTAIIAVALIAMTMSDTSIARDLGAAATNAVSTAKTVTRAISLLGLLAGGALMQIPGLAEFGKRTMIAGLVGGLCAFGGPAIIKLFENIFGGM